MHLKFIQRVLKRIGEMRRSSRFGVVALRRGSFRVPSAIRLGNKRVPFRHMGDDGTKEDFFSCFIDDVYGLTEITPEPRTILDIGANVGFFSLAARGICPSSVIHAYEPNPRVLGSLKANSLAGGFQFYPEAVGASVGWVSMIDQTDSNQAQTSAVGSAEPGGLPQVGLAAAIERLGGMVDLLKMDCEGAEWDIFKALDAWPCVRELRMEYHLTGGRTVDDVRHALESLSFRITRQIDQQGFGLVWATHA